MRYCDTITITCTSGAIGKYVFRVNDLYDPDVTGTGHQPLYRDSFASIYDFYVVTKSHSKITFSNTSAVPVHCGVTLEDDNTSSTSINVLMEQNTSKHKMLPPQTGSLSSHTFQIPFDSKKFLGWDPMASETAKTNWPNSPNVPVYMVLFIQPVDASTTATYYCNVEIDFEVYCTDLQTPTVS